MGSDPILAAATGGRGSWGWLDCPAEAWPSGRRHTPGKRVGGQLPRGFEPLSLRHQPGSSTCGFAQAVVRWSVLGPFPPRHGRVPEQPVLAAAVALADALGISMDQLAGKVTYDLDLSGDWWCAWQTWKDGAPRIDTHPLEAR